MAEKIDFEAKTDRELLLLTAQQTNHNTSVLSDHTKRLDKIDKTIKNGGVPPKSKKAQMGQGGIITAIVAGILLAIFKVLGVY